MSKTQQAQQFLEIWRDVCDQRKDVLMVDWTNCPVLTSHVFTEPNSIIEDVATRLHRRSYCGYYSIDAILFKDPDDLVPDRPPGTTWVRRIRIAFEHENYFNSGLFQEVSHLLITDCDLRVVVSYPDNRDELDSQLKYLHRIIEGTDRSNQVVETGGFLFIAGWRNVEKRTIEWEGYVYELIEWRKL